MYIMSHCISTPNIYLKNLTHSCCCCCCCCVCLFVLCCCVFCFCKLLHAQHLWGIFCLVRRWLLHYFFDNSSCQLSSCQRQVYKIVMQHHFFGKKKKLIISSLVVGGGVVLCLFAFCVVLFCFLIHSHFWD